MVTLHLGVVDVAYSDARSGGATTTGRVAAILEKNYGVMKSFYALREPKIARYLADDLAANIQRTLDGVRVDPFASPTYGADQKIETEFRSFIFSNEMSRLFTAISGTPLSAAAARGVNHRLKRPFASKNKARPAFVDTGLYVASFRAWTTVNAAPAAEAVPVA